MFSYNLDAKDAIEKQIKSDEVIVKIKNDEKIASQQKKSGDFEIINTVDSIDTSVKDKNSMELLAEYLSEKFNPI